MRCDAARSFPVLGRPRKVRPTHEYVRMFSCPARSSTTLQHWHTGTHRASEWHSLLLQLHQNGPVRVGTRVSAQEQVLQPGASVLCWSLSCGVLVLFDRCVSRAVTLYTGPCLCSKHFAARGNHASLREEMVERGKGTLIWSELKYYKHFFINTSD